MDDVTSSSSSRKAALVALALAVVAPVALSVPGAAAVPLQAARPLAQHQVRAVPRSTQIAHPVPLGPHLFYGTITAIHGAALTLRLRNGGLQAVDASAAIASDSYSAPLFVGKLVSVDGNQVGTAFIAAHVFRLSSLNGLPVDK